MPNTATILDWTDLRLRSLGERGRAAVPADLATLVRALEAFPQSAESEDVDFGRLTRIVASNQRLQREVTRQLAFNLHQLSDPATCIGSMVETTGASEAQLLLISCGLQSVKKFSKSKLINGRNFWAANHERGLFAWEVADLLGTDRFLAFTAAMVQDFLLPYLTTEFFKVYLRFVEAPDDTVQDLAEFEKRTLGWDHARAAANVMAGWGFPDDLVCCVLFHHGGFPLLGDEELRETTVAAVAIASLVPESLGQVSGGLDQLMRLQDCWADFDLLDIARRVDERLATIERRRLNHIPLWRRCQRALAKRPRA